MHLHDPQRAVGMEPFLEPPRSEVPPVRRQNGQIGDQEVFRDGGLALRAADRLVVSTSKLTPALRFFLTPSQLASLRRHPLRPHAIGSQACALAAMDHALAPVLDLA